MFLLFAGNEAAGKVIFGVGLILMMVSLLFSVWEIHISVGALDLHLCDLENDDEPSIETV